MSRYVQSSENQKIGGKLKIGRLYNITSRPIGSSESVTMSEEPKRKFRLNAKNLFLTWPRNNVDSATVLNKVVELFGADNVNYVCVSEEEHKDGSPHLHAVVCLKKPCDIRDVTKLDAVANKHGNYQSTRSVKDVYNYVRKGGNFVEYGKPPTVCTGTKGDAVAQSLRSGSSLEAVEEMDPGYFMSHLPRIMNYHQWISLKKLKETPKRPPLQITNWRFKFEVGFPREFKQKQYWIVGPPNTGKTTFIMELMEAGFRGYNMPKNNYWNDYCDDAYDFAYIDEFKGQLPMTLLNEFLQGSPMKLRGRYADVQKRKNLAVFILSNFDPYGCYENCKKSEVDPLVERLHIVFTQ